NPEAHHGRRPDGWLHWPRCPSAELVAPDPPRAGGGRSRPARRSWLPCRAPPPRHPEGRATTDLEHRKPEGAPMNPYLKKLHSVNREKRHSLEPSKPSKPISPVERPVDAANSMRFEGFEGASNRRVSAETTKLTMRLPHGKDKKMLLLVG